MSRGDRALDALLARRRTQPTTGWRGQVFASGKWQTILSGSEDQVQGWRKMTQDSLLTLWSEHGKLHATWGRPQIRILNPCGFSVVE